MTPGAVWLVVLAPDDDQAGIPAIDAHLAALGRRVAEAGSLAVECLAVGPGATGVAKGLATFLPRVWGVPITTDGSTLGSAVGSVVAQLGAQPGRIPAPAWILVSSTPDGRDAAGVIAVRLDWGLLANATEISWVGGAPTVESEAAGGRQRAISRFLGDRGVITVALGPAAAAAAGSQGEVQILSGVEVPGTPDAALVQERDDPQVGSIESARIIVAGGRGLGSGAGFDLVRRLAAALGGQAAGSLAAVDAGWLDHRLQIGQTGRTVRPDLYIGAGISGAIGHLAGMRTARTIVVLNTDPDAPLTEIADLVVVGDALEMIPALLRAIEDTSQVELGLGRVETIAHD